MELMATLFKQIVIMFILMFLGAGLFKTGKISKEGTKSLGNILIYVIMPAVVVKAFLTQFTWERLVEAGHCLWGVSGSIDSLHGGLCAPLWQAPY